MRINRVIIKNFRSIRSAEFFPQDICALVGENNAGKTSILTALNFLLGEAWPSRKGLELSDYYAQNTDEPIYIEVKFEDNSSGIKRIWCLIPWEGPEERKVEYLTEGECNLSAKTREKCALVYLDATRDLQYHLGHSRWTLFGKIIRQLNTDFTENTSEEKHNALIEKFNETLSLLKTPLYDQFENELNSAFNDQLKKTVHGIKLEFRSFDPLNYYRSIQPILIENGLDKSPLEAGQGMKNLLLMALFRTYARVFRGDAIIAIEEPEIYLHPHAQRSLFSLFKELASRGNQIFFSTHSGNFIEADQFDKICLVEKYPDSKGQFRTGVRQVSIEKLLKERKEIFPDTPVNELGLRQRYRTVCKLEHNEGFFAHKIVLVEGDTEKSSLPIYASALGYDFDANGISVISADGKSNLYQFFQLYKAFGIPVYLVFDNDRGGKDDKDLEMNERLLTALGQSPTREPDGVVDSSFTILEGNFERQMADSISPSKYEFLRVEASRQFGGGAGKGIVARFMANKLVEENKIPSFIKDMIQAIKELS